MDLRFENSLIPINNISLSIYGVVFFGLCVAELICAFFEWEKPRKILKPFCVGVLFLIALFTFPMEYCLYLSFFFGMVGDIFFIFKDDKRWVSLGLLSFLIDHVFMISEIAIMLGDKILSIHVIYLVFFFALFYAFSVLGLKYVFQIKDKFLLIGGGFYSCVLVLDFAFQIMALTLGYQYFISGVVGGVLFIMSDSILTYTLFKKDFKRRDFPIMFTYLAAQFLFFLSFFLTA